MIRLVSPNPKAVSTNAHTILPLGAQASIRKSRSSSAVTTMMTATVNKSAYNPRNISLDFRQNIEGDVQLSS